MQEIIEYILKIIIAMVGCGIIFIIGMFFTFAGALLGQELWRWLKGYNARREDERKRLITTVYLTRERAERLDAECERCDITRYELLCELIDQVK